MDILEITGLEQIFLGLFLIAHGLIHLVFLIYSGWLGRSLFIDKVIPLKITTYIGKIIWVLISILFVLSGISVLDLFIIDDYSTSLIVISSIIATAAFIIFYNGLSPTPYHWILGVVINLVLITFVIVFANDISLLVPILILIWLWGMFFHTKVIPEKTAV